MTKDDSEYTADTLFGGRLHCSQHRLGYRYSIDSILLAHFIIPKPGDHILDLGAGCGIISLIIGYRWPAVRITALEIQPRLAALARRNAEANHYRDRLLVIEGDLRGIEHSVAPGSFDLAVCNPPYRSPGTGRRNSDREKALARHEINADLPAVCRAAAYSVRTGGRAALVYPAARGAALISAVKEHGLEPKRLRVIYSYPGGEGKLILLETVKNGGEELRIIPPFYIFQKQGGPYTKEMAGYFETTENSG